MPRMGVYEVATSFMRDGCCNDQPVSAMVHPLTHPRDSAEMLGHSDAIKVMEVVLLMT